MTNEKKLSSKGIAAGTVFWLILVYLMGTEFSCVRSNSCSGGDFVLGAIIAIGFVGPTYLLAEFLSPNK